MQHISRALALLVVVALVAAACGGDEADDTTTTAASATTTTAAATTTAPDDGTCDVDEIDGTVFNLYNWSEYIDPELISAFEAAYGVDVIETFYDSNEAMLAVIEAGGAPYDLIVPSDYMVTTMSDPEVNLLIPLQKAAIPNLANLDPTFTGLPFDADGTYSVPYQWGTTGIGFAYEIFADEPDPSWAIVFEPDPSYAGKISLLNDTRETLAAALFYLGYSANTTDQGQLDEAVTLLQSVKDSLAKFDSDQFEDDLVAGETLVAHGYSGDFFAAYDEASTDEYDAYDDFGYLIPQEGAVAWVDTMAIPKTAQNPCTAHTFINFILDPENGAALTNYNFYASPNAAAEPFIDPDILEDETIYPPPETFERLEFLADTGAFELNYQDAFNRVKG